MSPFPSTPLDEPQPDWTDAPPDPPLPDAVAADVLPQPWNPAVAQEDPPLDLPDDEPSYVETWAAPFTSRG